MENNESKNSIKQWAEDDRPREKLLLKGKSILSDAELVAILIGSGSRNESAVELSKRILQYYNQNLTLLGKQSVKQLTQFKGIGEAKAISIVAALELGKRRRETEAEIIKIKSAQNIFDLMHPFVSDLLHEEFWAIFLNNSNVVLHKTMLSKGGITASLVDIRILFKLSLEHNATGIVLVHNHPSGTLQASAADKAITKKIIEAGKTLDIQVLDHVIITEKAYFSFANEGII